MKYTDHLLQRYPIISDQVNRAELRILLTELEKLLQQGVRKGSVVEFGCYAGTTSLFIRRLLDHYNFTGEFHVYDSFEGLPEKSLADQSRVGEQFVAGELAASKKELIHNFRKAQLAVPVIHKGWFSEVHDESIPDSVVFAFLDGDYYDSIIQPLHLITPKLACVATIVVDDYSNIALPGAQRATDEWLKCRPHLKLRVEASLAIIFVT